VIPVLAVVVNGAEIGESLGGQVIFKQQYIPSKTEKYAAVIHPYRLCIFAEGKWNTVWKLTTGPAPRSINFRCVVNDKDNASCKVIWDGNDLK
jgi:hypothetical protein